LEQFSRFQHRANHGTSGVRDGPPRPPPGIQANVHRRSVCVRKLRVMNMEVTLLHESDRFPCGHSRTANQVDENIDLLPSLVRARSTFISSASARCAYSLGGGYHKFCQELRRCRRKVPKFFAKQFSKLYAEHKLNERLKRTLTTRIATKIQAHRSDEHRTFN